MGCHFLLQDLPNPGMKPGSPALQTDTLPSEPPGKHFSKEYTFKFTCNYFISFPSSLSLSIWKILMKTQVAMMLVPELPETILAIFNSAFLKMINKSK